MSPTNSYRRPLHIVGGLLLLGLSLRAYHYLRDPAVWHDEAAVLVNVLPLGFAELLGPLRHAEAAPPLFLWLERATAVILGDGTLALRLPAALAGVLTLVLIAWVAWREAGPTAAAWATLLVASSDRLLWHGCEAKPYAFDAACAAVMLAVFSATRAWPLCRRMLAFVPLFPPVIWLTYPGCFVCGGVLLALLPAVWQDRRRAALAMWAGLAGVAAVSFALMYFGPARAQRCPDMESCWRGQFPKWGRPWTVPVWSVASTFDVLRYCFQPCGYLLTGFTAAGTVHLCRVGRRDLATVALAPLGLNLVAAWLHGYPFGGARVVIHAAPGLALLTAAGVGPCLAWLRERWQPLAATVAVLFVPLALSLYRVVVPWDRADTAGAAAYVASHRAADEPVFANHWEYEYYFRGLGDQFRYLPPDLALPPQSAWVVLTSGEPRDLSKLLDHASRGRRITDHHSFTGTIVARVEQAGQSLAAR